MQYIFFLNLAFEKIDSLYKKIKKQDCFTL